MNAGIEGSRMKFSLGVALFIIGVLLFCWFLNSFAPGEPKDGVQDHEASNTKPAIPGSVYDDGTFEVRNVPPGRHTLLTRNNPAVIPRAPSPPGHEVGNDRATRQRDRPPGR